MSAESCRLFVETNNQQSTLPIDEAALEAAARATMLSEGVAEASLSLAVVNGVKMRELNNQFLQHDYDTDVLSFLLEETNKESGRLIEGEIIVSIDTAIGQAADHGMSVSDELALYVVHGSLHLCGYDDLTDGDRAVMRLRESEVLAAWRAGLGRV